MAFQIMGLERLLDPFKPVGFKVAETLNGRWHIPNTPCPRSVNYKLQVIANHLAHLADDFDIALAILTKDRLGPHTPASLDDAIPLFAHPAEFIERPVEI